MKLAPPEIFPSIPLSDLDGRKQTVHEGAPRLVILGHRDCKTTRQTLPYVDRIHRRRPGTAVAVLQDEPSIARELIGELDLALPVLLEPNPYPLAEALGLTVVPTLVLLDRAGRITTAVEGFRRDALEGFALALDVSLPLFGEDDTSPAFRPG